MAVTCIACGHSGKARLTQEEAELVQFSGCPVVCKDCSPTGRRAVYAPDAPFIQRLMDSWSPIRWNTAS